MSYSLRVVLWPVVPIGLLQPAASTPGVVAAQEVGAGQQILLPTGVAARIGNSASVPATIVVISISIGDDSANDNEPAADDTPATLPS